MIFKKTLVRFANIFSTSEKAPFFTKDHFRQQIAELGWHIGEFSYGKPIVIGSLVAKLHIGKYCSISENCSIILADHNSGYLSTYPFLNINFSGPVSAPPQPDPHAISKGDVSIGNDVWIGRNAIILSGVRIGNGAVIGAGAVVAHDVPPYAVVVGNPGRVVKYRFDKRVIVQLERIKWWDWSPQYIFAHASELLQNPNAFLERYKQGLRD